MSKNNQNLDELKRTNYEIFIWLLTVLAFFNIGLVLFASDAAVVEVAQRVTWVLCIMFFLDFLNRLRTADSRQKYFFKQYGWLDLIGSIPITGAILARLLRFIQTTRSLNKMGQRRMFRELTDRRADTVLLFVSLCVILLLEFGSIAVLKAEVGAPDANILTAGDAFWWVIVTIATVGYGDEYPVTEAGRFVGAIVIVAGVAVFGTLSGYLAHSFLGENMTDDAPSLDLNNEILTELKQLRQENANLRQMQEQTNIDIVDLKTELRDQFAKTDD